MTVLEHTHWEIPAAENADATDARSVKVSAVGSEIIITWLCGDTRTFKAEDLASAIAHVRDSEGTGAEVRIEDSNGDDVLVYVDDEDCLVVELGGGVPWGDLRKALKKQLKALGYSKRRASRDELS